ncbi:MAG TPA: hypothetical protein VMT67_12180 [Terriglobales bacterium]|nr:hypothetical protein [Terriglobales bacterium]
METTSEPVSTARPTLPLVAGTVRELLTSLIDYAGLFPPAALPMAAAVSNYDAYLKSPQPWMLGRFIVPVARIGEFEEAARRLEDPAASKTCSLSVLPGAAVASDLVRIGDFNDKNISTSSGEIKIASIEVRIASVEDIERLSSIIPAELETYFEIPLTGDEGDCIAAVARCGRRAKIRTGGETADKFPAPGSIVRFIKQCAASGVPFKATAGLHHPIRSCHRLTYQRDSPSAVMHGFLNVFLVAAFLRAGLDERLATELLAEESPSAFHFEDDNVRWREHRVTVPEISAARRDLAISFGSCSFTEPVEDLQALHLI